MTTNVVNRFAEPYDVYIGRGTKWGNPFVIGVHGDRKTVIAKYAAWIKTQPQLLAQLHTLKGKKLGCFCAPKSCHGHVLADMCDTVDLNEFLTA